MEPPFSLHARDVRAVKAIVDPGSFGSIEWRLLHCFSAETKFVDRTRAAMRARQQERHYRPNTFLVPARGRLQMADASSVRAAISSGSRWCTSDFPQERASI